MAAFHLDFHFGKEKEVAGSRAWPAEPAVRQDFAGVGIKKMSLVPADNN